MWAQTLVADEFPDATDRSFRENQAERTIALLMAESNQSLAQNMATAVSR